MAVDNRNVDFMIRMADRLLEAAQDNLHNSLLFACDAKPMILNESGFGACPACNRLFSPEHVDRKPNYCEDCGHAFEWPGECDA